MVEVNNLTEAKVNENFIKETINKVLKGEDFSNHAVVSVALIGPGRMRKLNKAYRKKNKVTDVLSFPEEKVSFGKFKIGPKEKIQGLGEMVICPREVKKSSRRTGASFEHELKRVIIHGALHLLGYDHEKEVSDMEDKEKHYLSL